MNCKEGDLAVIIGCHATNPGTGGVFCNVLYRPPSAGYFELPDGTVAVRNSTRDSWVIKLQRPTKVKVSDGGFQWTTFAVCPDSMLRPIRDQPGEDITLQWAPVPGEKVIT